MRVLIVGAGMLGVHHALAATLHGWSVVLADAHSRPDNASVRNLGAIRVSGRAPGRELDLALTGRRRWESLARRIPPIQFREVGSVLAIRTDEERAVADAYAAESSGDLRIEVMSGRKLVRHEPGLLGHEVIAGLVCHDDAVLRIHTTIPSLLRYLEMDEGVTVHRGSPVREIEVHANGIRARTPGDRIDADLAIVCPGDSLTGLYAGALAAAPLRRVRLHVIETSPVAVPPRRIITDSSAFFAYPGYAAVDPIARLPAPTELERHWGLEFLVVARDDGRLVVGVTHVDPEPTRSIPMEAERWLRRRVEAVLGRRPAEIIRRWSAVYAAVDRSVSDDLFYRREVEPGVWVITGMGQMGNTMAPAIARETIDLVERRPVSE